MNAPIESPISARAEGEAIILKLFKVHSLSRAIGFMSEVTIGDDAYRSDTFRASIEEVNKTLHACVLSAIDDLESLAQKLPDSHMKGFGS